MDEGIIRDMIKVELWLEKPYYDELLWLCKKINENDPTILAEAILQTAIDNTVNDPNQVDEWVRAFSE